MELATLSRRRHEREPAADLVEWVLEHAGIDRPPVDAVEIARALGLEVRISDNEPGRGRLVRRARRCTICVRSEPRTERRQWIVAHEIGESLLANPPGECADALENLDAERREQLANRFASLLLVPPPWLAFDAPLSGFDLLALKQLYQTASHEVLAWRLLDLDPPSVVTVFDQGRLVRRAGNLPHGAPPMLPIERACQQSAARTGRTHRSCGDGLDVRAWPIHEPPWQREILRTVFALEW